MMRPPPRSTLFPTRRSSDLFSASSTASLSRASPSVTCPARAQVYPSAAALQGRCTDRKSTRLNSSHLGISYAVFCLKKKKHTRDDVHANTADQPANDDHQER